MTCPNWEKVPGSTAPWVRLQILQFGVPIYNTMMQTGIVINLWPNCGLGFMLVLLVLLCKSWNVVKPGAPLARPPTRAQFSSVQSLSRVQLFVTPRTTARQASLSITNSQSLLKLMSIELMIPSNHLIVCRPLLLPPSIFPSIRVFQMSQFFTSGGQRTGVSASASVLPMNMQDWFPLRWTGCWWVMVTGC